MLYVMGTFHTLSQLRLHTTHTLKLLRDTTIALGEVFRKFREISSRNFKIKESPREMQARIRNQNRALQSRGSKKTVISTESKKVELNLNTIKNHMLEHYAPCITDFGTMDSYSTELVSSGDLGPDHDHPLGISPRRKSSHSPSSPPPTDFGGTSSAG
jgi:hypothetical protein